MRRLAVFAFTCLLMLGGLRSGHAHALLDRSEPPVGNTVPAPPQELRLWFTQNLEAAFSTIAVTSPAGQRVDTGKPRVSGNQISVALRAGGNGVYHVKWRMLSTDTHTTEGSFTFTVGP
jgi:methionine-rich copper-binding protein CopC